MQSSANRTSRMPNAFTLIELLVVLVIISILIAIMLPVLRLARDTAQMMMNASNLRQIQIGVHTYAGDNDSYLPYRNGTYGTTDFWPTWAGVLVGQQYVDDPLLFWGPKRDISWFGTGPYDTTEEMLASPMRSNVFQLTGYAVNERLMANAIDPDPAERVSYRLGTKLQTHSAAANRSPTDSEILLMTEVSYNSQAQGYWKIMHSDDFVGIFTWPGGTAVQAYLDGHVVNSDSKDIGWTATGPTTGSWYPSEHNHWKRQAPWFRDK